MRWYCHCSSSFESSLLTANALSLPNWYPAKITSTKAIQNQFFIALAARICGLLFVIFITNSRWYSARYCQSGNFHGSSATRTCRASSCGSCCPSKRRKTAIDECNFIVSKHSNSSVQILHFHSPYYVLCRWEYSAWCLPLLTAIIRRSKLLNACADSGIVDAGS